MSADLGVEGIVLKRLSARYWPGQRTRHWRKVKVEGWREHAERRRPGGQRATVHVPLAT